MPVLLDEDHAGEFEGGKDIGKGPIVRCPGTTLKVGDRLNRNLTRGGKLGLRPWDKRPSGPALSGGKQHFFGRAIASG
jgi:hypothetical protein